MDETTTPEAPDEEKSESQVHSDKDTDFQAADFQQVDTAEPGGDVKANLDLILDVPVTLSLEVGRTEMSVGNLLKLSQGAIVELDRNAGELLDVMVNGSLVAHGEIVVVNDKFGIRLVDVVSQAERAAAGC